jgi:hypothetical protein
MLDSLSFLVDNCTDVSVSTMLGIECHSSGS